MSNPATLQGPRLRLSLAAAALVVATSAADPAAQAASGAVAAATSISQTSQAGLLKKIQAYCTRSWQNAGVARHDWSDCTQEVFVRLLNRIELSGLERAISDAESPERRELNRAVWATTQKWRRSPKHSLLTDDDVQPTESDPWPARVEALRKVNSAIESGEAKLSPTQKEIVARFSDGESISSIAGELKLSPARVSDEKYKAIQKLRRHFGTA